MKKKLLFIKWELYVKFKKRYINSEFFIGFPKWFCILSFIIINILKMLFSFIAFNLLFSGKLSSTLIAMPYIGSLFHLIIGNHYFILLLFLLYILLDIIYTSIDAVKIKNRIHQVDWYVANTDYSFLETNLLVMLSEIFWSIPTVLTIHMPFIIVILNQLGYNYIGIIFLSILFFVSNLLVKFILGMLYDLLTRDRNNYSISLLIGSLMKIAIIWYFYVTGKRISPWFASFPLVQKNVEIEVVIRWFSDAYNYMMRYLSKITDLITNNLSIIMVFSFFVSLILSIIFIKLFKLTFKKNNEVTGKDIIVYSKHINKKMPAFNYFFIYSFKTIYKNRKLSNILGTGLFWAITTIICGIFQSVEYRSKIYYLLLFHYTFFPAYMLVDTLLVKISDIYLIEGEGKKIYFWRHVGFDRLLKYKKILFTMNIAVVFLLGMIMILVTTNVGLYDAFLVLIIQFLYAHVFFCAKNMASLNNPNFKNTSDEERKKNMDKNITNDSVGFIIILSIIIACIPLALYITDEIKFLLFFILQFYAQIIVLTVAYIFYHINSIIKFTNDDYITRILEGE